MAASRSCPERPRSHRAISPDKVRFVKPPICAGASEPASRWRFDHFEMQDQLMSKSA